MVVQQRRAHRQDRWGNVRCTQCHRWLLPVRFRPIPGPTGYRPKAECLECEARRAKRRYNRMAADPLSYRRHLDRCEQSRRARRRAELEERREFVQLAIRRLGDLGFSRGEVARLCGTSGTTIHAWAEGRVDIHRTTARKVARVMRAAVDVSPVLPAPNHLNPFQHHPDFYSMLGRIEGEIA